MALQKLCKCGCGGEITYKASQRKRKVLFITGHSSRIMSEETKQKMSLAKRANPTRYWLGKKRSKEVVEKIRLANTGRLAWNKGKKNWMSEESKRSMIALKKGKTPYVMTNEIRDKMSRAKKGKPMSKVAGENHWAWIEDRTKLARYSNGNEYRNSSASRDWSGSVKNRDGWKCKMSNGDCSGQVVAHHILTWKDYPELRYEVNNGITLCHFHHPRKRNDEMSLAPLFQEMVLSIAQ